jgi:putative ABC transport system permease protein
MSLFRLVLRDLLGRPSRNGLTALGIAIGVGAFVALVALADSFTASLSAMFASRRTDISVVRANSPDVLMSSVPETLWPVLAEVPGVAAAAPVLAEMLWAEEQPASLVVGMAPDSYLSEHLKILQGRALRTQDDDVALLGRTLAARLKKGPGAPYEVESHTFRVVGIYDADNTLENAGAVVPLRRLQWLLNREGELTAVNLRVRPDVDCAEVAEAIRRQYRNLKPIRTSEETQQNAGLQLARAMSWATSLVALFIGLVGTLNSMLMTVIERTREMGMLRAIGWQRWRIAAVLLAESLFLSAIGALLGLGLGVLALKAALSYPKISGLLTPGLSLRLVLQAFSLALGLGLLGGFLPALRGSGMDPTEALRQE